MDAIAAVVFDIGGVVQDSPLHAIARYEHERGIEANAINRVVVAPRGEQGAWARLERGELTVQTFIAPFEADCRAQGIAIDGRYLMARIAEASVAAPAHARGHPRESGRPVSASPPSPTTGSRPTRRARASMRTSTSSSSPRSSACASPIRGSMRWSASGSACRRRAWSFLDDIGRQPQAGARARNGDDQGRRSGSGVARARGAARARPRRLTAGRGQKRRRTPPRTVNGSPIEMTPSVVRPVE